MSYEHALKMSEDRRNSVITQTSVNNCLGNLRIDHFIRDETYI